MSKEQLKDTLKAWSEMTSSDIEESTNFRAMLMFKELLIEHFPDRIAEEISLCSKIDFSQDLGDDELKEILQPFATVIIRMDEALLGNGFGIDAILKLSSQLSLEF